MHHLLHTLFTAQTEAPADSAASLSGSSMMDMLDLLLVIMFLAAGAYCLYTFFRLRRECMLFDNKLLYPGDCKYQDCADPEGFMDFIQYRILILGAFLLVCGIFFLLNCYVFSFDLLWIDIAQVAIPILGFAWYVVVQRKAAKSFW